jgi:hypothetical protein
MTDEKGAGSDQAAEPEAPEATATDTDTDPAAEASADDDLRARFREALARKHSHDTAGADDSTGGGSKGAQHTSGPHKARAFRRKSG